MSKDPDARQGLLALFLIGFLTFALLYAVQPLLPALAQQFALSAADSALALSVSTGALALSIFLSALCLAPRHRKAVMLTALLLAIGLNALSALCHQWWPLLLCRALMGLCLGAIPATAMAYLADTAPVGQLTRAMGLYVAGNAMGGMTGRVGIAVLADLCGWRVGLLAMSALGLCALGVIGWSLRTGSPPPASARRSATSTATSSAPSSAAAVSLAPWLSVLRHPRLPKLFVCGGLASGIFVTAYNYAGFRLLAAPFDLRPAQVGLIFGCYLFGVASSSLSGRLVDALGTPRALRWASATTALGIAISLSTRLPAFVAGLCTMTAGFFAMHAICSSWVGREAGAHKAQATALYLLAYYLGGSILGYAGGGLWGHGGWPLLCAGLLGGLALFAALVRVLVHGHLWASVRPATGAGLT